MQHNRSALQHPSDPALRSRFQEMVCCRNNRGIKFRQGCLMMHRTKAPDDGIMIFESIHLLLLAGRMILILQAGWRHQGIYTFLMILAAKSKVSRRWLVFVCRHVWAECVDLQYSLENLQIISTVRFELNLEPDRYRSNIFTDHGMLLGFLPMML